MATAVPFSAVVGGGGLGWKLMEVGDDANDCHNRVSTFDWSMVST